MKIDSAIFYSNDLDAVIVFYRDVLGLKVDYIQENRFASFHLDNGKIGIKQKKEDREIPGHQTVFVMVNDIEGVYNDLQEKSVTILKGLTREDWATNFSILDPDGNKVQFISN